MVPKAQAPNTFSGMGCKRPRRDQSQETPCRTAGTSHALSTQGLVAAQLWLFSAIRGVPGVPPGELVLLNRALNQELHLPTQAPKTSCSKKPSFMVLKNCLSKSCPDVHFRAQSPCLFILACKVPCSPTTLPA